MQHLYPPKPSGIPEGITTPSPAFKREVAKVFLLCVLFLLWYFVLLACVICIAFVFGLLGVLLVSAIQHFATLMLALGAIVMGIMLIFFMLKALVLKKADPIATVGEITIETDPAFYNFIKKVCEETEAPFPKRIFLVEDVNAFVSYDSSFMSLLFPSRKNLYVGLGLINTSTISELKAIIAHEFGHFSQGSMRFGSYVYHFNQIIYKIVADNSGYDETVQKWANFSGYFALFANINVAIIKGIQWLMVKCYEILNKGYMSLARQMEFHADTVAVSVAGSAPLITSLYRMELAAASYDHLLSYYNELIKDNLQADNLYVHHFKLMQLLAERENVPFSNGFPIISSATIAQMGRNRIVVKDQWASHPPVEDREAAALRLNIISQTVDEPAWKLFENAAGIQEANTARLYQNVEFPGKPVILNAEGFVSKYKEFLSERNFQPEYKGYYNNRYIPAFDTSLSDYLPEDLSPEDLFSDEYLAMAKLPAQIENEIATLDAIIAASGQFKSFDFEGLRYPLSDADSIKDFLKKELEQAKERLKEHDQQIYYIARRNSVRKGNSGELENAFDEMFRQANVTEKDLSLFNQIVDNVTPVYSTMPVTEITKQVAKIVEKETELKKRMLELIEDGRVTATADFESDVNSIRQLCESSHVYFSEGKYLEGQLDLLQQASGAFLNLTTTLSFRLKKNALQIQLALLQMEQPEPKL